MRLIKFIILIQLTKGFICQEFKKFHCDTNFYKNKLSKNEYKIKIIAVKNDEIHILSDYTQFKRKRFENFDRKDEFFDSFHPFESVDLNLKELTNFDTDVIYGFENGDVFVSTDAVLKKSWGSIYRSPKISYFSDNEKVFMKRYINGRRTYVFIEDDGSLIVFSLKDYEIQYDLYDSITSTANSLVQKFDYIPKVVFFDKKNIFVVDNNQIIYVYDHSFNQVAKIELKHFLQCDLFLKDGGLLRGILQSVNKSTVFVQTYYYQISNDKLASLDTYIPDKIQYYTDKIQKIEGLMLMNEGVWFYQLIENIVYLKTSKAFFSYKIDNLQTNFDLQKKLELSTSYKIIGIVKKDENILRYFTPNGFILKPKDKALKLDDNQIIQREFTGITYIFRFNNNLYQVDKANSLKILNLDQTKKVQADEKDEIKNVRILSINGTICAFVTRVHFFTIKTITVVSSIIITTILCLILFSCAIVYFKRQNRENELMKYEDLFQTIRISQIELSRNSDKKLASKTGSKPGSLQENFEQNKEKFGKYEKVLFKAEDEETSKKSKISSKIKSKTDENEESIKKFKSKRNDSQVKISSRLE